MASVIGVGLVAVYQAQQGMDKTAAIAQDDAGSENAPDPFADTPSPPESQAEEPKGPTPLADDPFGTFTVAKKSSSAGKSAAQPTLLPAEESENQSPFEEAKPTTVPVNAKSARTGPGLNFRDEPAFPETKTADASEGEQQTPTRLPDDLDALEADVLKSKRNDAQTQEVGGGIKPFVRQVRPEPVAQEIVPVAASDSSEESDPFAESAPVADRDNRRQEYTPEPDADPFAKLPPKSGPISPVKQPANSDPFGGKLPATPKPEVDPFATQPNPSEPTLGAPAAIEEEDLSTPFENEPKKGSPAPTFTEPDPLPKKKPARRDDSPKLPTSIPDPLDEPSLQRDFPDLPEPKPARLPERQLPGEPGALPTRRPADPQPKSLDNDLLGDGVVDGSSPRGLQQPRLTIEKVAPQQATLGEMMIYSIIIKNVGNVDAQHVVVEDRIPKGTEMNGSAPRAEIFDKKLIWKIGTLKPNEEKKISIRVIPQQEGPIGSVARVSFATEAAAEIVVTAPQLSFNVKAPKQARMGETIELTFLLKNTGTAAATNVSVRDLVPAGLKHEAATDIECPIGKLAPNETREIVLSVVAVKPGRAVNRAVLTGDGGISQELESVVEVIGEQLVLTRSGQTKIYVDRPTVFTNNIKNEGNAEVKQVRVSEIVPAGMEFVEASDGGRFDPIQKAIFWDVGALPPGAETVVSSKLVARTPGTQQAKVSASGPAGSTAAVKSEVDVVGRPELQIETVGRTGVVTVGDRLTSKIQLKNHGSAVAKNVSLSIQLPPELKMVEVRGSQYTIRNNMITFDSVAAISPKELVSFEVVMEAVAEAPDAQMSLEILADHLTRPAKRSETVQIAAELR
ncbi:MAG: conserved repeat domain protein [Schlesneria sp.]|nr:conserved repeat domain protein [Schlesneria sp.]